MAGVIPTARDDATLRALLFHLCEVDTTAGILIWKRRSVDMFPDQRACDSWNTRFAGKEAGSTNKRGYREVQFAGRLMLRHRLIWLAEHGAMPLEIDHQHGTEAGDGIGNLRNVDHAANMRNQVLRRDSRSGCPGVDWYVPSQKWRAVISAHKKRMHLGYFDRLEDAIEARKAAERRFGFHENHGRAA